MEDILGFILVLLFFLVTIIAAVVRGLREQKARRQGRGGPRPTVRGEYSAPAKEVRKFLEAIRSRQQAPAQAPERPRARQAAPIELARPREIRAEAAAARSRPQIDRAILERQRRLEELASRRIRRKRPAAAKRPQRRQVVPERQEEPWLDLDVDDVSELRRAIVYSEILGRPRALRPY